MTEFGRHKVVAAAKKGSEWGLKYKEEKMEDRREEKQNKVGALHTYTQQTNGASGSEQPLAFGTLRQDTIEIVQNIGRKLLAAENFL